MFEGYMYYGAIALFLAILAFLSLSERFSLRRSFIVCSYAIILVSMFGASIDLMSRPRPVDLMLPGTKPNPETAQMYSVEMKRGEYIMLLLKWDELEYARYFQFPWSDQMAEDIEEAQREAKQEGSPGIELTYPFDQSLDRREHPYAHPLPVPKQLAPKKSPEQEILEYNHPSQGA